MLVKTNELQGAALDYAVAKCEGWGDWDSGEPCEKAGFFSKEDDYSCALFLCDFRPSTNWAQGGPIIEREIFKIFRNVGGTFTAQIKVRVPYYSPTYGADVGRDETVSCAGPTSLIAAMRCYVASKLGEEVEVPDELYQET